MFCPRSCFCVVTGTSLTIRILAFAHWEELRGCESMFCCFVPVHITWESWFIFQEQWKKRSEIAFQKGTCGECWYSHLLLSSVRNSQAQMCFTLVKQFFTVCAIFLSALSVSLKFCSCCLLVILQADMEATVLKLLLSHKWSLQILFLQFSCFSE